jgi:hypothetical protein
MRLENRKTTSTNQTALVRLAPELRVTKADVRQDSSVLVFPEVLPGLPVSSVMQDLAVSGCLLGERIRDRRGLMY